ncbi:hypothetical protein OHB05_37605 [Streptomyces sp. NBC_00638]|uniref:hypothetical protein n=1 Tax=unclassified Streptomyces TaxID=2593676 RepID=UPI002254D660|nr:hypothetical protein [Streptomyces sp. NBC_00638]MCX5008291.1 hypothetical protein [Streptomyces sp. NBC_00638]
MSFDVINAVNWSGIPNPTRDQGDDPEGVAEALRLLTVSTTANETGDAAARLAGRGFVWGHAAMVFPAAYAATPILLDLVEHGRRPRIRDAAVGLVSDALGCFPAAGFNRVDTSYGADVPLCCAIARHIRGRRDVLLAHGRSGKRLLAEAELHWRLTLEETERRPDGSLTAIAFLEGTPFDAPAEAEVHAPSFVRAARAVCVVDALTADASGAACVQLGQAPAEAVPGCTLHPAECGLREH